VPGGSTDDSRKFAQLDNLARYGLAALPSAHLGVGNGRFGVSLWGKNLNNPDSAVAVSRYSAATNQNLRACFGTPRLPRQIRLAGASTF
jgi:hypothetical protein